MQYRIREQKELKPSGVEWLGDIPKGWNVSKLKYIADIKTGYTPPMENLDNFSKLGILWVKPDNLNEFKIINDSKIKISEKGLKKQNIIKKGSILVCCIGSIGKFGIAGEDLLTNQQINSVTFKKSININFSKYLIYISSDEHNRMSNGNVVRILNTTSQGNIYFPFFNEKEQQKIANFLDKKSKNFDDTISKKEELITKLQDAKQSLISEVVTGKLKVIQKDGKLQTIKRENEELINSNVHWLGDIPKDWVKSRFDYETRIKARLGWKGLKAEEYVDEGYAFLATPNIKYKEIDFENVNYITKKRYEESPEIMLVKGDVLLTKDGSTTGTVNVVRVLPKKTTVNSSIAVIRPKKNINSLYLYYFISSTYLQDTINLMLGGMGVPHLFQGDLNKFKLLVPSIEEQKQISKYLDEKIKTFDNTIKKTKQSIIKLKQAKEALISEAVTGKIEIL